MPARPVLDLNADLGEGFGPWTLTDDAALLDVVTSANVACGFHAGDAVTMRRTCEAAAARGVAVGAHVAYRDLAGFGRRAMDVGSEELAADVLVQIGALRACARAAGTDVRYVKAHGALYNRAAADPRQADALVAGVVAAGGDLPVLCLAGSETERAARARGLRAVPEAFADRASTADGRLVARDEPGAVLTEADEVVARALALARVQDAASVCLHGDTPGAVVLARLVRAALERDGFDLRPFA